MWPLAAIVVSCGWGADVGATIVHWVIIALVIAGVIGIAYVVAQQAGVAIPPFIVKIFWIVLAVVIGVVAISFLAQYL